ncbi:hypothetical protein IEQ34_008807 [Dendrobium chrysotoxum]|uniref:Uncharacterized protein n=1 Tax=Dendrobium chrysotoxum TaxID=161865 RepID=A0AAV7GXM4_DENCH|nr:hypothetical protein IEQ34_008807 [Dendrobium chrysotoxum]
MAAMSLSGQNANSVSCPATRTATVVMDSPAFVPAKDAVESLLRQFVSPLLPRLKSSRPPPTVEEQEKVGKQMHAVVILYNYYQRKESPISEYLDFRSFCEIACISYSSLIDYMKFMCNGTRSFEDDQDQLSITENFVMNACDICSALNASIDSCNINEWAISKVAVFLVDAAKEKCLLKNGHIILGSWSLVEKDLEKPIEKSVCSLDMNYAFKNRRTANESDKCNGIEDFLQEFAYSIVEQDMGITCSNLNILEYHLSYSLSQPRSSTRLYIMTYKGPGSSALEISIKDVTRLEFVSSLRGPPVKCSSYAMKPEITSVAEHYCLLPYIDIIAEWATRKTSQGDSPHLLKNKALPKCSGSPRIATNYQINVKSESTKGASDYVFLHSSRQKVVMGEKSYYGVYIRQNHNNVSPSTDNLHLSRQNAMIDVESAIAASRSYSYETKHGRDKSDKKKMKLEYEINELSEDSFQHRTGSLSFHDGSGSRSQSVISNNLIRKDESTHSKGDLCLIRDGSKDQVVYSVNKQCQDSCDVNTLKTRHTCVINQGKAEAIPLQLFPSHYKFNDYAARFLALTPNKDDLEAIVFDFLKNRRDDLCCQHRQLEDFIAQCEMNIQLMINGENQVSHPEVIMKASDFLLSSKVNRGTCLFGEVQLQPHDIRRRLFDADLRLRSS